MRTIEQGGGMCTSYILLSLPRCLRCLPERLCACFLSMSCQWSWKGAHRHPPHDLPSRHAHMRKSVLLQKGGVSPLVANGIENDVWGKQEGGTSLDFSFVGELTSSRART